MGCYSLPSWLASTQCPCATSLSCGMSTVHPSMTEIKILMMKESDVTDADAATEETVLDTVMVEDADAVMKVTLDAVVTNHAATPITAAISITTKCATITNTMCATSTDTTSTTTTTTPVATHIAITLAVVVTTAAAGAMEVETRDLSKTRPMSNPMCKPDVGSVLLFVEAPLVTTYTSETRNYWELLVLLLGLTSRSSLMMWRISQERTWTWWNDGDSRTCYL